MSEYNAGHTDRIAAERRAIDSYWDAFQDTQDRFGVVGPWTPPPMSELGKQLFQIGQPTPQELDAIAKMEKDLLAKLERANKIDRLKAELDQKAEELRALGDTPESLMTNEELDQMLDALNRQYHADTQAELTTETRAFPAKPSTHDE